MRFTMSQVHLNRSDGRASFTMRRIPAMAAERDMD